MAQIARAEPAIAERLGVGGIIHVIARAHRWPGHADFPGFTRPNLVPVVVLNADMQPGAFNPASTDPYIRAIFGRMILARQIGDTARHLA